MNFKILKEVNIRQGDFLRSSSVILTFTAGNILQLFTTDVLHFPLKSIQFCYFCFLDQLSESVPLHFQHKHTHIFSFPVQTKTSSKTRKCSRWPNVLYFNFGFVVSSSYFIKYFNFFLFSFLHFIFTLFFLSRMLSCFLYNGCNFIQVSCLNISVSY